MGRAIEPKVKSCMRIPVEGSERYLTSQRSREALYGAHGLLFGLRIRNCQTCHRGNCTPWRKALIWQAEKMQGQ